MKKYTPFEKERRRLADKVWDSHLYLPYIHPGDLCYEWYKRDASDLWDALEQTWAIYNGLATRWYRKS